MKLIDEAIAHFKKENCIVIRPQKSKTKNDMFNFPDLWIITAETTRKKYSDDKYNYMYDTHHIFFVKLKKELEAEEVMKAYNISCLGFPFKKVYKENGKLVVTHNSEWLFDLIDYKKLADILYPKGEKEK